MNLKLPNSLLMLAMLFGVLTSQGQTYGPELPEGYLSLKDETYTTVNGWEGKADIYYNPKASKPTPVVVEIHGGGWSHGNRAGMASKFFLKQGFAVMNIDYRLVDIAPAPAAIEDARCALHYLALHAKQLNIDPLKIIVSGNSAGGHLALMAGLMGNRPDFDGNCPEGKDFKVTAIIDNYGPTDLAVPGIEKNMTAANFIGKAHWGDQAFKESISPVHRAGHDSPPIFIVHGDADPIVPIGQSLALKKKMDQAGAACTMVTEPGGGHGGFTQEQKKDLQAQLLAFISGLRLNND